MQRLKVFISHTGEELAAYYSEKGLEVLRQHAELVFNESGKTLAGIELANAAAGCQVILAHRSTPGNADTFEAAPGLLAFVRSAVDVSTVDILSASSHGILVTRASAGFGVAVAEMALAMMFDLGRGVSRARHAFERGEEPRLPKGLQLRGASVGILGYGTIGGELAKMTQALGMRVRVFDPRSVGDLTPEVACSFEATVAQSDFLVCLAASVPETHNLINEKVLSSMREGSFFLNLSRGELVDEDALEKALDSGWLRGAGLDVGRAPDQRPSIRFINRPDVVVMPHVGGMTVAAREHQTMDTVRQITALAQRKWPEGALNAHEAFRVRSHIEADGTCR
ncbi:NAD(P)-dependent oxidoreductase [Ottowia caeni]|uniref:NAD(P)-dependent oxidoreductase n=1 Tax=Ottowia caeni TaxID=2870339 RepID=UPI001E2C1E54|nr:hydroxyacid dehydrogenase [Ottowia caeni]